MGALNWALIDNGGVMESLMHQILFAKDPQTLLFGRPGRDSGQDARSADGSVVYQSKYRSGMNAEQAIVLANEELAKIKNYRLPSDLNNQHWKYVNRWVLFANFLVNPNDVAKWNTEIVPAFRNIGITAEYWDKTKIEGELVNLQTVRDLFFGQKNRVFVGLHEARLILENDRVRGDFLHIPLLGREKEMEQVHSFAASDNMRLLPVFGPGGIGKTRFLYDSLVELSKDGWHVLWALPNSMSYSNEWLLSLGGTQKTCVAIDDPEDHNLLRAVIEQFSFKERQNWRIIFAASTERSESFRRFKSHRQVGYHIELKPLKEPESKYLINDYLEKEYPEHSNHKISLLTQGNPGWLCLLAYLLKRNELKELPTHIDEVASLYVESCLKVLEKNSTSLQALTLLRWISLWGSFVNSREDTNKEVLEFLDEQGIHLPILNDLLKKLVETGIMKNFGVRQRLFAVQSNIIRHYILSEWLLQKAPANRSRVSSEGEAIVSGLVKLEIPKIESILQSLTQLSSSRLDSTESDFLMRPIFEALSQLAREGDIVTQNHVITLLENCGSADPERALDIFKEIRLDKKANTVIKDPFWGNVYFDRSQSLSKIPWILFNLSKGITNRTVARRYLLEFREYLILESTGELKSHSGKSPSELLKRLLTDANLAQQFISPAFELADQPLEENDQWSFVDIIVSSLLEPTHNVTEWTEKFVLSISKKAIAPGSDHWEKANELRARLWAIVIGRSNEETIAKFISILNSSHRSIYQAIIHEFPEHEIKDDFKSILLSDLTECLSLLNSSPPFGLAIYARKMWSWYLLQGHDQDLREAARKCESVYNSLSDWKVQDFFRFARDEELAADKRRITKRLREATSASTYNEFFDKANQYLCVTRIKQLDSSDIWRITELAESLVDLLSFENPAPLSPVSEFVSSAIKGAAPENEILNLFLIRIIRAKLRELKRINERTANDFLNQVLQFSHNKNLMIWRLYSGASLTTTGQLNPNEVSLIFDSLKNLEDWQRLTLLGVLIGFGDDEAENQAKTKILQSESDQVLMRDALARLIVSANRSFIGFERVPPASFLTWIINTISEYRLDGSILTMLDLEMMRDKAGFRMNMRMFNGLMKSRIELEGEKHQNPHIELLPHDFEVNDWIRFDSSNIDEIGAFSELCELALLQSFTSLSTIPEQLAQIDTSGEQVTNFVLQHLTKNPTIDAKQLARLAFLAGQFPIDSSAFLRIATTICDKTEGYSQRERSQVYSGLINKPLRSYSSRPGIVANAFYEELDKRKRLFDRTSSELSIQSFFKWAFELAEEELNHQKELMEEFDDE